MLCRHSRYFGPPRPSHRRHGPQDGHPLNFHHFGGINLDKLQKNMTLERFWRTVVVNCEALPREVLPAASEAAGKRILGTFVIVDLAGFGYVVHDTGVDNALIRAPLQNLTILANEGLCAELLPGFARLLPRNVRPALLPVRSRAHRIPPLPPASPASRS